MVINGYSLVIGIIIGIFVTVIVGLVIINREPKVELEPQKVKLPEKQSSDVFAYREDAEDFVRKLKELPSGVSDISISPRIVYLDKDKTLDNVD